VNDIERTGMLFDVGDDTNPTDIVTTYDVRYITHFEFGEIGDFILNQVVLDGIVDLDFRVGESDGSSIMGYDVRDPVGSQSLLNDLTELELSFFFLQGSKDETSLGVIENSEFLVGLFNGDNVHNTGGESDITSGLVINLNVSFTVSKDHKSFVLS